jgi:hypothetical protein
MLWDTEVKKITPISKDKWARGVAQVVACLLCKCENKAKKNLDN